MPYFVSNNLHLLEVFPFLFCSKESAAEAHGNLQKAHREAALNGTTCRDWVSRFNYCGYDVNDR